MANIWVQTLNGSLIRADTVAGMTVAQVSGEGWTVIAQRGRGREVLLSGLGRGTKARKGAERLCREFPLALAAAKGSKQGVTLTIVKTGYPKGGAQWSTLAAAGPVRAVPFTPPDEPGQRRGTA